MSAANTDAGSIPIHHADIDAFDDVVLVAWVRLYALADAVWPANAPIPRWVRDAVLGDLGARLWVDVEGGTFRIPELDSRRVATTSKATKAANSRWAKARQSAFDLASDAPSNAPSNASSNAPTYAQNMPTQTQTQKQKQKQNQNDSLAAASGAFQFANGRLARRG